MSNKKLYRPTDDIKIAGVCAGIAKYFNMDATIVRIIYVVLTLSSIGFPGMFVYLLLMLVMPKEEV